MSAVMALSLAACASSKPATPEEVLQAASEKVSAAKSMTCETTTQMKMSAGGQSIQMTMTGELETTIDPVAMHMDMTTDMGAMGSMNVKMYMKEENGAYSLYTGMDDGSALFEPMFHILLLQISKLIFRFRMISFSGGAKTAYPSHRKRQWEGNRINI